MAYKTLITDVGHAKIAEAQAGGTTVNLTTFKAGDANGNPYEPTGAETALVNVVYSDALNSKYVDSVDNTLLILEHVIPAASGPYVIREVGIFDSAGDMIAIAGFPETTKPDPVSGAGKDITVRLKIRTQNASIVELTVDDSIVYATREYVNSGLLTKQDTTEKDQPFGYQGLNEDGEITKLISLINNVLVNSFSVNTSVLQSVRKIEYAMNLYIAIGYDASGSISTSPDGITWSNRSITSNLWASLYSRSLLIVAGYAGAIATSTDGVTWNPRTSNTTENLWDLLDFGSLFVAIGTAGAIVTSPNGTTWVSQVSNTIETLNSVAASSSLIVAVGNAGSIVTSPDGVTWTPRISNVAQNLNKIMFSGALWIAVGNIGTIVTSQDGITWTPQTSNTINNLNDVIYRKSLFILIGPYNEIITSQNAIAWDVHNIDSSSSLRRIADIGTMLIAVGYTGNIMTSADGFQWEHRRSNTTENLYDVIFTGKSIAIAGYNGSVINTDPIVL